MDVGNVDTSGLRLISDVGEDRLIGWIAHKMHALAIRVRGGVLESVEDGGGEDFVPIE